MILTALLAKRGSPNWHPAISSSTQLFSPVDVDFVRGIPSFHHKGFQNARFFYLSPHVSSRDLWVIERLHVTLTIGYQVGGSNLLHVL
jgi:hypothetical protein